ncbi:MAG: hypothetical protein P8Y18_00410 [Candidatus Bathyarchaeota archaeon]
MRKYQVLFSMCLISSILVSSLVLISNNVLASEIWQHTYGGINDDRAYSVIQITDEGYALAGFTMSYGAGLQDFYLIKTDENGNLIWNKTYGGAGADTAKSVIQTSEGGYALVGDTTSFGNLSSEFLSYDFWLVKTDNNGNMLWNKTYGYRLSFENGTEYSGSMANSLVQTNDGGYALAGRTYGIGAGFSDFYLVKTDENGNILWNQTYGGAENDNPLSMIQTSDGGFALAGYTESFGAGSEDFWLVKTDSLGNMEWNKTYGGSGFDEASSLLQTIDGGYILIGSSTSVENGSIWMVKTDENGNVEWNKQPSPSYIQLLSPTSVAETSDGGFAISGDFWVIKTDVNGDILFYQSYEPQIEWFSAANCLIQASNGDYVLAGYRTSIEGDTTPDVLLVKTDSEIPIIWNVTRTPSSPIENSTYTNLIKANVYDESGIKEVTLSYSVDSGSWSNLTMTKAEGNIYSAEIQAYPKDTNVFWTIIAENNVGKSSRIDNEFYNVIPEFPLLTIPVVVIPIVFVLSIIYRRKFILERKK